MNKLEQEPKNKSIEQEPTLEFITAEAAVKQYVADEYEHFKEIEGEDVEPIRIWFPAARAYSPVLGDALLNVALENGYRAETNHLHIDGPAPYVLDPRAKTAPGQVKDRSFFIGGELRSKQAVASGETEWVVNNLHSITGMLEDGTIPIDVAMLQVTPPFKGPDGRWKVSLGPSVEQTTTVIKCIKEQKTQGGRQKIIALVNKQFPRTDGPDAWVDVNDIDCFIGKESKSGQMEMFDQALEGHEATPPSPKEKAIGENIVDLIPDAGASMQFGIGGVPDAVAAGIADSERIEEVEVFSEMGSDGTLKLMKSGKVKRAQITFFNGSAAAFKELGEHPEWMEFCGSAYVNDPAVISKRKNMFAINGALKVDALGQVFPTYIPRVDKTTGKTYYTPYGGEGGQRDFMAADHSVIALDSQRIYKDKQTGEMKSEPKLAMEIGSEGGYVTTPASMVKYIATEFGAAALKGKTNYERPLALIDIAHPDDRITLLQKARENHLLNPGLDIEPLVSRYKKEAAQYQWMVKIMGQEIYGSPARLRNQVFAHISSIESPEERRLLLRAADSFNLFDSLTAALVEKATPTNQSQLNKIVAANPVARLGLVNEATQQGLLELPEDVLRTVTNEAEAVTRKAVNKRYKVLH